MGNECIPPPLKLDQGLGAGGIERAQVPPALAPRPPTSIHTLRVSLRFPHPFLLTQGVCLLPFVHSRRLRPWELEVWTRVNCMTAGELWGGETVPTQQASNAQACTTHLVSNPLTPEWVLTPLCPFIGCSVPASTTHVEALVTDAVQASTSSRGSPPPRTAPMSASVRIPH